MGLSNHRQLNRLRINVLASQASQLRKLPCKLCLQDDAFSPHHRRGDRTDLRYCVHNSAKGQQIARALRTLFRAVDGRRGTHRCRARRGETLLFRAREPYKIRRLHHAQHLSGTLGLPVRGSVHPLHFTRGHAATCIPSAARWYGFTGGARPARRDRASTHGHHHSATQSVDWCAVDDLDQSRHCCRRCALNRIPK